MIGPTNMPTQHQRNMTQRTTWPLGYAVTLCVLMCLDLARPVAADQLVTDHGATPDDARPDTAAIQAAIDAAAESDDGVATIPRGRFVSGGLKLRSNVTLNLAEGAVLQGSDNFRDYGNGRWTDALIKGENLRKVRIQGQGTIDGVDCRNPKGEEGFRGPHGIFLIGCRDIVIRGVTLKRTGNYAVLCRNSREAVVRDVTIRGGHDGLHAQACRQFEVRDCDFRTGDDCYAGCDNVDFKITDCQINSSCNAFRLGCVNLLVKDCRIWGPGEYQHRVSNRKNMLSAFVHFAPRDRQPKLPSDNWRIEDVTIENVGFVYGYDYQRGLWQKGQPAKRLRFHRVKATEVERPIRVLGDRERQFELTLDHVSIALRDDRRDQPLLDLNQFGSLVLRDVTLKSSGAQPVVRARDGNRVVIEEATVKPANRAAYDLRQIEKIERP